MRPLLPITVLALLSGTASAGDIYCLNKGKDCSDRPTPGAEYIRTEQRRPDAPPPEPAPGARPAAAGVTPAPTTVAAATRQSVQKDLDQVRAEQCKKDKDIYQQSLAATRIYRTNKSGEREYLTPAQADEMRMNARINMEQSCGTGTQ